MQLYLLWKHSHVWLDPWVSSPFHLLWEHWPVAVTSHSFQCGLAPCVAAIWLHHSLFLFRIWLALWDLSWFWLHHRHQIASLLEFNWQRFDGLDTLSSSVFPFLTQSRLKLSREEGRSLQSRKFVGMHVQSSPNLTFVFLVGFNCAYQLQYSFSHAVRDGQRMLVKHHWVQVVADSVSKQAIILLIMRNSDRLAIGFNVAHDRAGLYVERDFEISTLWPPIAVFHHFSGHPTAMASLISTHMRVLDLTDHPSHLLPLSWPSMAQWRIVHDVHSFSN